MSNEVDRLSVFLWLRHITILCPGSSQHIWVVSSLHCACPSDLLLKCIYKLKQLRQPEADLHIMIACMQSALVANVSCLYVEKKNGSLTQKHSSKTSFFRPTNEAKLHHSFSVFVQMGHSSLWMLPDHKQACGSSTHHSTFVAFLLVINERKQELQLELFICLFSALDKCLRVTGISYLSSQIK